MAKTKGFILYKPMAHWWNPGYGGEHAYHSDFILKKGAILSEVIAELLADDSIAGKPAQQVYLVHLQISLGTNVPGHIKALADEDEKNA